jgi:hypothetical protein
MSIHLTFCLALLATLSGCDEKPSVVGRERLAFLEHQQEPLLLETVIQRVGPTPPGQGPHGSGPYYGYAVRDTETFVEFWFSDGSAEQPDRISMVLETGPDVKAHIIWPKRLVGTNPHEVLRKTWPKMYH